jgi:hypothetical protein
LLLLRLLVELCHGQVLQCLLLPSGLLQQAQPDQDL